MGWKIKAFLPTLASLLVQLKNLDDPESGRGFFNTHWKHSHGEAIKSGLAEVEE